jgi:serine/threonine protein kinase
MGAVLRKHEDIDVFNPDEVFLVSLKNNEGKLVDLIVDFEFALYRRDPRSRQQVQREEIHNEELPNEDPNREYSFDVVDKKARPLGEGTFGTVCITKGTVILPSHNRAKFEKVVRVLKEEELGQITGEYVVRVIKDKLGQVIDEYVESIEGAVARVEKESEISKKAGLGAKTPGFYELGDKSYSYMASRYIEGKELFDVLKYDFPTNVQQFEMGDDLLKAADRQVDAKDLVHRDIKPENVMTDQQNHNLKLIDFGLALNKGEHAVPAGTEIYMAPESALGRKTDLSKSDSFSLGVCLWAIFGGCLEKQAQFVVYNKKAAGKYDFAEEMNKEDAFQNFELNSIEQYRPVKVRLLLLIENLTKTNPIHRLSIKEALAEFDNIRLDYLAIKNVKDSKDFKEKVVAARKKAVKHVNVFGNVTKMYEADKVLLDKIDTAYKSCDEDDIVFNEYIRALGINEFRNKELYEIKELIRKNVPSYYVNDGNLASLHIMTKNIENFFKKINDFDKNSLLQDTLKASLKAEFEKSNFINDLNKLNRKSNKVESLQDVFAFERKYRERVVKLYKAVERFENKLKFVYGVGNVRDRKIQLLNKIIECSNKTMPKESIKQKSKKSQQTRIDQLMNIIYETNDRVELEKNIREKLSIQKQEALGRYKIIIAKYRELDSFLNSIKNLPATYKVQNNTKEDLINGMKGMLSSDLDELLRVVNGLGQNPSESQLLELIFHFNVKMNNIESNLEVIQNTVNSVYGADPNFRQLKADLLNAVIGYCQKNHSSDPSFTGKRADSDRRQGDVGALINIIYKHNNPETLISLLKERLDGIEGGGIFKKNSALKDDVNRVLAKAEAPKTFYQRIFSR